jgi:hypothetical protein
MFRVILIITGFPNFPKKLPDIYDYRDGKKEVKRIAFWELIHSAKNFRMLEPEVFDTVNVNNQ